MSAKRTRKISLCMVILLLLLTWIPVSVRADDDTTKYSFGHFYYHSHKGYVSICGYLGRETDVEIPSVMSGRPVSEIESGSFDGCDTIKTITVPDTVVMVYADSFTGASSLKKIISNTVGVELQADSGVEIEYRSQKNNTATDQPSSPEATTKPAEQPAQSEDTAPSDPKSTQTEVTTPSDKSEQKEQQEESTSNQKKEGVSGIGEGAEEITEETPDNASGEVKDSQTPDSDESTTADKNENPISTESEENTKNSQDEKTADDESGKQLPAWLAGIVGIAVLGVIIRTIMKKNNE